MIECQIEELAAEFASRTTGSRAEVFLNWNNMRKAYIEGYKRGALDKERELAKLCSDKETTIESTK